MSFHLVTKLDQYFVVGCYIPPNDLTALQHTLAEWKRCPRNCTPVFLGDLNINLDQPFLGDLNINLDQTFGDAREQRIVKEMDAMGLEDLIHLYCQWRR